MLKALITYARFTLLTIRGERGQDLIEYAMLGGLVALAIIGVGVTAYTLSAESMFEGIGDCVDFESATPCDPF